MGLAVNYEANIVGDVVGMVFDGLDTVTAGIGHGNTIEDIVGFFDDIGACGREVFDLIVMTLQGQLNLRGGDALKARPRHRVAADRRARPLGREVSADSVALDAAIFTLGQMQGAHRTGDELMGEAAGMIGDVAARADEVGTAMLDGQDPFAWVRDRPRRRGSRSARGSRCSASLALAGTDSAATTDGVLANVAEARAAMEALEVPRGLGGRPRRGHARGRRRGGARRRRGSRGTGPPGRRWTPRRRRRFEALDTVEANAGEIGEFMTLLAEQSTRQAVELEAMLVAPRGGAGPHRELRGDVRDADRAGARGGGDRGRHRLRRPARGMGGRRGAGSTRCSPTSSPAGPASQRCR